MRVAAATLVQFAWDWRLNKQIVLSCIAASRMQNFQELAAITLQSLQFFAVKA